MRRVRIIFSKGEGARFLSHLDLISTLEYGLRRARLPVELSEGYNPRPRMSLAAPLPLGYIGEQEILELALREPVPADEVLAQLQAALPSGIRIIAVEEMPVGVKSSASRVSSATYRIELPSSVAGLEERIRTLLARETLEVQEEHDGGIRVRDIRSLILSLEAIEGNMGLRATVRLDGSGTVRPERLLALLGMSPEGVRIVRERIDVAGQ